MPQIADPTRRIIVSVDMESYSRRDNMLQYRAQQSFRDIMSQASDELGLDRSNWTIQQAGDGELATLPPGTSERHLISQLPTTLDRLLRQHNHGLEQQAQVRLRVAVHEGLVHLDGANGFPGEAVVTVSRLIDSPQLKAALKRFPSAGVAMIVSDRIYQDVVRQYRELRPERYQQVTAALPDKGFEQTAWIHVPDEDASGAQDSPGPGPATTPPVPGGRAVTNVNNGQANMGDNGTITNSGPVSFGSGQR
ncbi:hypothetical protein [Symbioplanes lichenis]|uniref:hypothetical protein n=1 Tax=Symbioplanes lichenis TaxID=1629072 RepID=UPI002739B6BF|nr:hypothetical protein [Actinoplanes lichenis]